MNKSSMRQMRKLLVIMYVLTALWAIAGLHSFLFLGSFTDNPHRALSFPQWYSMYYLASLILGIVFLIGLINWRKWGSN